MKQPVNRLASGSDSLLNAFGWLLVLSGLFHVAVWLTLGGVWEGPVSWRKPILFGLSTGVTLLSVAWVCPKVSERRADRFWFGCFGVALVVEVALITLQQWRGVASHFNNTTPFDSSIEISMTLLIVFASLVIFYLTRRCFGELDANDDIKLAIRGGMVFLTASCLIGFAILYFGIRQVEIGNDPITYGKEGVTKFPHGVAIHAIQFLPLCCWLMARLGIDHQNRVRITGYLIAATTSFLLFSIVQTLSGRARFDLTLGGGILLAVAALFLAPILGHIFHIKRSHVL